MPIKQDGTMKDDPCFFDVLADDEGLLVDQDQDVIHRIPRDTIVISHKQIRKLIRDEQVKCILFVE